MESYERGKCSSFWWGRSFSSMRNVTQDIPSDQGAS
jgi:hypothetical protein